MAHESHIWLPKYQDIGLELPKPTFKGQFKLIAGKANSEERVVADWQDNLILNSGLDRMGMGSASNITNNTVIYGCAVGSSNTTPAVNQTALGSLVAWTTSLSPISAPSVTTNTSSPYQTTKYGRYRFGVGAAAGNLAEVGFGWGSTTLFSRALIKDGSGNPTTITILSDEYLDVIYAYTIYPPINDSSYSITLSGTPYNCVTRAAYVNRTTAYSPGSWAFNTFTDGGTFTSANRLLLSFFYEPSTNYRTGNTAYSGAIGAITGIPSGTATTRTTNLTLGTYTNGSFTRSCTDVFGLAEGSSSFASMHSIFFGCGFQTSFDPVIPKTSSKILTLNYSLSWGRYTP